MAPGEFEAVWHSGASNTMVLAQVVPAFAPHLELVMSTLEPQPETLEEAVKPQDELAFKPSTGMRELAV
ncbi:hypothetical protein Nepgr_018192 [Nepenthes gracilis]|uniref:Uncharacterized protein n=1 Tax=Nepenthes gracilis TaxID=150966 RepID=A0AAD3XU30_NEPGR|nr:hypothetical protein Nepgr_018192 [Nepenthes gracilis]